MGRRQGRNHSFLYSGGRAKRQLSGIKHLLFFLDVPCLETFCACSTGFVGLWGKRTCCLADSALDTLPSFCCPAKDDDMEVALRENSPAA